MSRNVAFVTLVREPVFSVQSALRHSTSPAHQPPITCLPLNFKLQKVSKEKDSFE